MASAAVGKTTQADISNGVATVTINAVDVAGWIQPKIQSNPSLTHDFVVDELVDLNGDIVGQIASSQKLTTTFEFMCVVDTADAANVLKTMALPDPLSGVEISGLPIHEAGDFTDCWNTNSANTEEWIYQGGGSISMEGPGKWLMTLPCQRQTGITTGAT
tara:strand:+ start:3995 stop:4474 length:480 start_codon:yes stop_codon:yes gene_type:complete